MQKLKAKDDEMQKPMIFTEEQFIDWAHLIDEGDRRTLSHRVKTMNNVVQAMMEAGEWRPFEVKPYFFKELITCHSAALVEKTLRFWGMTAQVKIGELIKKRARQIEGLKNKEQVLEERRKETHLVYGLGHNSMQLKINKKTMETFDRYECAVLIINMSRKDIQV